MKRYALQTRFLGTVRYMGRDPEVGNRLMRSTAERSLALAFASWDDANYFKFTQSSLKIWVDERYVEVVEITNEVKPLERVPYGLASGGRMNCTSSPEPGCEEQTDSVNHHPV